MSGQTSNAGMCEHRTAMSAEVLRRARFMRNRRNIGGDIITKEYSDEYYTPDFIPAALGKFDLDPCAGPKNHARRNIRHPECGLCKKWKGRVWMNPPYFNIKGWVDRFQAHGDGVCLVNSRTDTKWFVALGGGATAILFLSKRPAFERPDGTRDSVPVASVLIAYGEENADALAASTLTGIFLRPGRKEAHIK